MKKILVPIDFSDHSEKALKSAALFATKFDSEIFVLHMLDLQDYSLSESASNRQEKAVFFLKLAEKKLKAFLQKDYLKGLKIIPIIKHYKIFSEINEIAKEINAELIIMASHGASGLKEFFVGSNTEKVVRYSEVPVLVLKMELTNVAFNDVVVATDFSEEAIPAYKKILEVLEVLNARKHLLYVNTAGDNFKTSDQMQTLASNFLLKAEGNKDRLLNVNFWTDRTIEKGILNFSNSIKADMVAVITHGRKGLSHVFSKSISEDISNHFVLPIITFKI